MTCNKTSTKTSRFVSSLGGGGVKRSNLTRSLGLNKDSNLNFRVKYSPRALPPLFINSLGVLIVLATHIAIESRENALVKGLCRKIIY